MQSLAAWKSMLLSNKLSENKQFLKEQTTKLFNKTCNWSLRSKSWKPGLMQLTLFTLRTNNKSLRSHHLEHKSNSMRRKSRWIAEKLSKLLPQQQLRKQLLVKLEDHLLLVRLILVKSKKFDDLGSYWLSRYHLVAS